MQARAYNYSYTPAAVGLKFATATRFISYKANTLSIHSPTSGGCTAKLLVGLWKVTQRNFSPRPRINEKTL